MAAAIYSTTAQEGIDINSVFILDARGTPELPGPPFPVGELAWGTDGSEWVYCTASITLGAGFVVAISQIPGNWSVAGVGGATVAATLVGQLVGVIGGSQGSMVVPAPTGTQTGTFFWVQRAGNAPNVKCGGTVTKNAQLFSTATLAGAVNSSGGGAGTTYSINGMVIAVAAGSVAGPNVATLNYPVIGLAG